MSETKMYMWTVYDHPIDIPDSYVARKFVVTPAGHYATDDFIASDSLDTIRDALEHRGLTPIARSHEDDAKIVETWL